jgi:hypothetical protein
MWIKFFLDGHHAKITTQYSTRFIPHQQMIWIIRDFCSTIANLFITKFLQLYTKSTKGIWKVISASSMGTMIEWYDFYIFGSLAVVISTKFSLLIIQLAAFLSTLATFAASSLFARLEPFSGTGRFNR